MRPFVWSALQQVRAVAHDLSCRYSGAECGDIGYNFGTVNTSPTVKLGATECVESTWKSNEVMTCKSAVGSSAALNVLVTVDQNPGLTSKFLT